MADDLDFEDKFSDYIRRIEEAEQKADLDAPIITSEDLKVEADVCENITREQIGWRLYRHPMFYIVTVKKGTKVRQHSHEEDVFRYIIRGSLDIHVKESEREGSSEICRSVSAGQWVVVRAHHSYRIEAGTGNDEDEDKDQDDDERGGYVALIAYQMKCAPK